jgi:hypothetical protein
MSDDIVERVAKAIAETGNGGQWANETFYKPEHREFHRRRARAAVAAMRKPTTAMCHAGADTGAVDNDQFWITNDRIERVYTAMIDAALETPTDG